MSDPAGAARLSAAALGFVGRGLNRPECVVAHRSGTLFVPDWTGNGGFAIIRRDGRVERVLARDPPFALRPNGIALGPGGSVLLAHLGTDAGGVYRMDHSGRVEPVLEALDGVALPPSNFPHLDAQGRLWLTVSTRRIPRASAYNAAVADGFIVLLENGRARIAADGLGYTNECSIHPSGEELWVNETFARRLSAFRLDARSRLHARRTVTEFGAGVFPDGLAFDAEGHAWVTSIVSNRVIRVAPDGHQTLILEDADPGHLDRVERAYRAGEMGRPHLDGIVSRALRNTSNLAFGGPSLRTAYLGCLLGETIAHFPAPVRGHPLPSWAVDLGPLA